LITGAVSLAGAIGSAVYWADRASVRSDCGSAQGVACLNADTLDRQRNMGLGLTLGLTALGGTLFVLGLVLRHEPEHGGVSLRCGAAGLGLLCQGAF